MVEPGALEGVRVLELGRYIAAPFAGKQLGDLGADVVKVEDPDGGDPMRRWQGGNRPYSPQFAAYNPNKRSVALNLRDPAGRDAFLALARDADVLLENFRPGVADRLGIGWSRLRVANPRLVYCPITGFGPDGPYAAQPAYDTVISALSGLYSQILDPEAPQPVGPAFSDLLSGMFAVQAVLAALYARDRGAGGQLVEVSMLGAVLGFLVESATTYLDVGEVTMQNTRQRRAQAYACVAADGLPFVIHMSVPDKFWRGVATCMGRADLLDDDRFASREARYQNYAKLDAILKEAARARTRDEWFARFRELDLPHAPLNAMDQVFADAQVRHLEPVRRPRRPAPLLGEHTDEVLAEAGYGPDQLAVLRAAGAAR